MTRQISWSLPHQFLHSPRFPLKNGSSYSVFIFIFRWRKRRKLSAEATIRTGRRSKGILEGCSIETRLSLSGSVALTMSIHKEGRTQFAPGAAEWIIPIERRSLSPDHSEGSSGSPYDLGEDPIGLGGGVVAAMPIILQTRLNETCYRVFAESRQLIIKSVNVPAVVKAGDIDYVILDCDYDLENTSSSDLVVKWYFSTNELFYQWIYGRKPQATEPARKYVDLTYKASDDPYTEYRAMKLNKPGVDLTGEYTCVISTFEDERTANASMIVYCKCLYLSLSPPPLSPLSPLPGLGVMQLASRDRSHGSSQGDFVPLSCESYLT